MAEPAGPTGHGALGGRPLDLPQAGALHARLLAGDPVAPSDLAEAYLPLLLRALSPRFPRVDPHLVESMAIDALLRLAREPARYDPRRGGLLAFLRMDARGDLLNALAAEKKGSKRRVPLEDVELGPRARNLGRDGDPETAVLTGESMAELDLDALCSGFDARERAVVELMIDGERRTARFAAVIGLEHLPPEQQRREVKRWKDRLQKRLRRKAVGAGLRPARPPPTTKRQGQGR